MAKHKYTQMQSKAKREITRVVDGEEITFIRFRGILRAREDNPQFVEKPAGEDTRTWQHKRRYYWREVTRTMEVEKVTKGRKSAKRKAEETEANIVSALEEWRDELEAEEARAEAEATAAAEPAQPLPNADTSISEYVRAYVDTLEAAGSVRPSAISDYRTSCRRISEGIGDVTLGELTPTMIQAWEARLLKAGKGVNTVLKYHRLLNSVYKHAIDVRDVDWNPCQAVKKPKRVAPSPNSLDANQHARLCATLNAMGATQTVTAATIALFTGMRQGEVCGLRWKSYDRDAGTLRVDKAIAKAGGRKYETEPKTEASRRTVPVHPMLAATLEQRRERMVDELQQAGVTLGDKEFGELYVCGTVDGRYYDPTVLSRTWKGLAESFDLIGTQGRRVTFHDLRHSFATRAIAEGADVKAVAAVLGHSDAHVTLNVYADADKESKARAVALVGHGIQQQGDVKPFAALA